jgi:suppressor of G2 allele of SKP1
MASDLETRAKEAFIDDHFELAVDLYCQAITLNPQNAELFADRAQANIKLNNFTGMLFIVLSIFVVLKSLVG